MKKPSATRIREVPALSLAAEPGRGLDFVCDPCGQPGALGAWREHDERDQPIGGTDAIVFIAEDHPTCLAHMEKHPRLYAETRAEPGAFPRICGPCVYRRGLVCTHPDLKANGGPGLNVSLADPFRGAILCGSRGRIRPIHHAIRCAGRRLA